MFEKFSQWFDRGNPHKAPEGRVCDYPNCTNSGEYRAPKSRQQLEHGRQDWLWFCLEHVRDYNSSWNYYVGMSEDDQLRERLDDIVWQRPSWPLGNQGARQSFEADLDDPLGIFGQQKASAATQSAIISPNKQRLDDLILFQLQDGFTKVELQKRYRALAKQYHPDTNKAPEAVEKFRQVKEVYERLKAG